MCKHRVKITQKLAEEIGETTPVRFGRLVARSLAKPGMKCVKCGAKFAGNGHGWRNSRGQKL